MTPICLDMPDSPQELAAWLDRQLVGLELQRLIAELETIRGNPGPAISLEEALGEQLPQVLAGGLSQANDDSIGRLLRTPRLLLDLQERVFIDGGDHWNSVPRTEEHLAAARRSIESVKKIIARSAESATSTTTPSAPPVTRRDDSANRSSRWNLSDLLAMATSLAAIILTVIGVWNNLQPRPQPPQPGWGFSRPGALAEKKSPQPYLESLAASAREWFRKRPTDAAELSNRLKEFRAGCELVNEAPHSQLAEADRTWLRERCQVWIGKIDGHIAALSNETQFSATLQAADETINKLIQALKDRAKQA